MTLINFEKINAIDPKGFRKEHPYPWIGLDGALHDEAFAQLYETLPDVSGFTASFGRERNYGQKSHDRYLLEYERELDLPAPWRQFIEELEGPRYRKWLSRMLGTSQYLLSYHWHYAPNGCSVSPHCDSRRKLGSHIFYFSPEGEWKPEWGGQTLVLDDGGKFDVKSSPDFDDFIDMKTADSIGNKSFLFRRRGNSWHGVKEIQCPEGKMRKVFIVVINSNTPFQRIKRWVKGKPVPGY